MVDEKSNTSRFIGLFLLGNFLFCYPVLTLFNSKTLFLGIPVFFLYLFSAWLVMIGLMIMCTETRPGTVFKKTKHSDNTIDLKA